MNNEVSLINIPFVELRSLVMEALKGNNSLEFKNFCNSIGAIAVKTERAANPHSPGYQTLYFPLRKEDENRVREVLWNLIIEQVLTIGDYHNDAWPYMSVTEYGKAAINSVAPVPHDPDGYLKRIKQTIPDLDPVIEIYIIESIRTYNVNQLLSATITLGCASEKTLLILIDTYKNTFNNVAATEAFAKKVDGRLIKTQFEEFNKSFSRLLGNIPADLRNQYNNTLLGVFEMIRHNRNVAGHPTGKQVNKETLFANLQVFIGYCKYAYELKGYLESAKHD